MKIKTLELIGAALDWAVAKTDRRELSKHHECWVPVKGQEHFSEPFKPSTDWSRGGPIIEREALTVESPGLMGGAWICSRFGSGSIGVQGYGPTPLIAAMRCFVASKLGNEIDVPEELL